MDVSGEMHLDVVKAALAACTLPKPCLHVPATAAGHCMPTCSAHAAQDHDVYKRRLDSKGVVIPDSVEKHKVRVKSLLTYWFGGPTQAVCLPAGGYPLLWMSLDRSTSPDLSAGGAGAGRQPAAQGQRDGVRVVLWGGGGGRVL